MPSPDDMEVNIPDNIERLKTSEVCGRSTLPLTWSV